jgi:hypothetical protein
VTHPDLVNPFFEIHIRRSDASERARVCDAESLAV